MAKEKKYHLVMNQYEAEQMYSLLDSCICAADDNDFVETFNELLKQLRDKLMNNKTNGPGSQYP